MYQRRAVKPWELIPKGSRGPSIVCTYVLMTIPPSADLDRIQDVLARFDREFHELHNGYLSRQLPVGTRLGTVTRQSCDCGTVVGDVGAMREEISAAKAELDRKFDHQVRENQSVDKLEKWVTHECGRIAEWERGADEKLHDRSPEAVSWVLMIRELLASGAPGVGIMIHEFSNTLSDERFNVLRARQKRAKAVTPAFIMEMKPDTLYSFVR